MVYFTFFNSNQVPIFIIVTNCIEPLKLRVVHTQSIFEIIVRVGSDIERHWILNGNSYLFIDSKPIEDDIIQIQSRFMSDPTHSDIGFKKWNGLGLDYP